MSWTTVSATILPLAGVVLGTAGTLLGQRFVTHADARRDALQRAGAQRAERKEAIIGFLSAAERIEAIRTNVADDLSHAGDVEIGDLTHALWLAKKVIELVCSAEVAQAAQDYTRELDRCTWKLKRSDWKGNSPDLSPRERELRVDFMEAARRELGYKGEPLRRRASDSHNNNTGSDTFPVHEERGGNDAADPS